MSSRTELLTRWLRGRRAAPTGRGKPGRMPARARQWLGGARRPLVAGRIRLLALVRKRPRHAAPSGGWGGPIALVSVGAAVATLTAMPALGSDTVVSAPAARAALGAALEESAGAGRIGDATASDDWDGEIPSPFAGTLTPATTAIEAIAAGGAALLPADPTGAQATSLAANGIPEHTLRAYQAAAAALAIADPGCRLDWALLAGIGRVESNHGRFAGAIVSTDGVSIPAVIGIRLDGSVPKTAVIVDSDDGRLDGDSTYDRAVGPMQFLPGSWVAFGADGDGDGNRNPQDIDDAALAAGAFLCSGNTDLSNPAGASAAVRRYNNSGEYVALVLRLAEQYRVGFPVGAIPVIAPIDSVPVQPSIPAQPAAPEVVLGLPPAPGTPTTDTTTTDTTTTGGTTTDGTTSPSGTPSTSTEVPPSNPPTSTPSTTPTTPSSTPTPSSSTTPTVPTESTTPTTGTEPTPTSTSVTGGTTPTSTTADPSPSSNPTPTTAVTPDPVPPAPTSPAPTPPPAPAPSTAPTATPTPPDPVPTP